jgi:MFS family permease
MIGVKLLPDSPRFLASVGRNKEAREVLVHLRGTDDESTEREYREITSMAEQSTKSSPLEFLKVIFGLDKQKAAHLGRRAWLSIFLQIMASWTGITAVTAYSPVLLRQAGYSQLTQNGLAGGLNTVGIVGTIISAQIVDRLGRRTCLMGGAAGLSAVNLIAASLYEVTRGSPSKASSYAPAAVAMLFMFNLIYAFLLPTEIFPSEMRAQGNGFGITGWALGVGMTVLINPILFASIENRAYFFFAALNLIWIPIIYVFYPETKDRSLESIESMFTTSPFFWQMEKAYKRNEELMLQDDGLEVKRVKSADQTSHEEYMAKV